jgi:hypothetical protein
MDDYVDRVQNAKSTTTVMSTVLVTMTQDANSVLPNTVTLNSQPLVTPQSDGTGDVNVVATVSDNGGGGGATNILATGVTSTTSPSSSTSQATAGGNNGNAADLSTGAKAGIGAGAGAAGLAVIGGLLLVLIRRQRPRPRFFNTPDISQLPVTAGNGSSWAPSRVPPPRHHSSMPERAAGLASAMARGRQAGSPQSHAEVGLALRTSSGGASPTPPSELGSSRVSPPSSASELMAGYQSPRDGTHEMQGVPENAGLGVVDEHYEMPGQAYYELPSPLQRT